MFKSTKKFVSIVLIVAMILSNAGMNVLAESFDNEQTTTTINENAGENLFGENTNPDNGIVSEEKNSNNEKSGDKENLEDKEENEKPEDKEEPEENEKPEDKEEPEEDEKPEDKEELEENENGEEGSTETDGEEGTSEESSESSVESTTESSESTSESSEESSESTSESSEESSNESTSESSEEGSDETLTTDATSASKSKIEDEEKTNVGEIATTSYVEEKQNLFGEDDTQLASESNVKEKVKELELIDEQPQTLSPLFGAGNTYSGTLLSLADGQRLVFAEGWFSDFASAYDKSTIKKIEFKAGVEINNRTWDLLVADDTNNKYRILSKTNVINSTWSWSGFNCRSFYSYAPYTDGSFTHEGSEIHKYLVNTFYNTFPQYYKDNMLYMDEKESYWSTGSSHPEMHDLHTKVRIPVPDEVDYLDYAKLKNGNNWWIAENVHRSDGVIGGEGAAVFPEDGNYDPTHGAWSFTNYAVYRASKGVRPVIAVTKDGLKYDPSAANAPVYTHEIYNTDDTTDPNRKLIGFAYLFDATGGGYNLQINMLYDNAFKINSALELFKGFTNCKEIKGLDLLDFSNALSMYSMFEGCSLLDTISFADSSLTHLKDTFGVATTNINSMFKDCAALQNINFLPDNFASGATTMISTFENTKLSAWPTKKDTSNVTDMTRMFAKNNSTTFDFDAATLSSCTNTSEMFKDSTALTRITVNADYTGLPVNVTTTTDMFLNCDNLVGGGGFRYKDQFSNGDFACVDYGGIIPGYFTCTDTSIYNNIDITISTDWSTNFATEGVFTGAHKIIFTHDDLPGGSANDIDVPLKLNGVDITGKAFLMDSDGSLIIQFVPQIQKLSTGTSWYEFFEGFTNVTNIEGLDLINTGTVTTFESAFSNCSNLATISFASLDVSGVTTIQSMFDGCSNFTGFVGDVPEFSSLVNAHYAFKGCAQLKTINIDSFFVPGLLFAKELFNGCSSLTTIYTSKNVVNCQLAIDTYNSENMFNGCTSLNGGQGTTYHANYPKHLAMANVDCGGIKPGYFTLTDTSKYSENQFTIPNTWYDIAKYLRAKSDVKTIMFLDHTESVGDFTAMYDIDGSAEGAKFYIKQDTDGKYIVKIHTGCSLIPKVKFASDMSNFLSGFTGLTTVTGWDKVDMTPITNMSGFFKDCSSLTELDLSLFNISNITNMNEFFRGCTNLATIRVTPAFVIGNGTSGDNMFGGCPALVGDHGTTFVSKFAADPVTAVDRTFATLDGRHGLDGYFTLSGTTTGYNVSSISVKTKPETNYYIGDHFFPNGLVLNVTWDDNVTTQVAYTLANAAKFTFDPDTDHDLTPADTTETVTFGGKTTSFTLTINPAIAYTFANNWFTGAGVNKNTVRSISFIKFPEASPSTITSEWDLPDSNGLKGYVIADGAENDIVVYAPHVGTILGAQDSSNMFANFNNITEFKNLANLVTSRMTDMSSMFSNCANLQTLNLTSFNTINVTDMQNMFDGCEELVSVNTSSFNTSKVINMNNMFYDCKKLTQVNTNNFNTNSARDMACMFYECNLLASLDVSSFNTSGVTDMQSMFYNCSELTALNLGGFNMKLVTSTENMFKGCVKLSSIGSVNLSSSEIRTCKSMFEGCAELTSVNLSNFNTSNIGFDGFESMFSGCTKVKTISLGNNFVLGGATTLANMFNGCEALESINLSAFASNSVNNVTAMFKNNRSLKTIVASNSFAVKNKTGNDMFENCDVLEGGAGTTFAAAGVANSSYAQVDEGTTNPGYFTWGGDVTITFVGGEGATGSMAPQTVKRNVSTPLNRNRFSKRGYTFVCWRDDAGNTYTNTIIAFDSLTLTAQWAEIPPIDPSSGGSSSSGGGGGGGVISGLMPTVPVTYIPNPKTISGVLDKSQIKWNYDPTANKFNLTASVNGKDVVVSNGFYTLIGTKTTIVNGSEIQEPTKETYYFNATGDMTVGWLVTSDGKKSFAEMQKNMSEGALVIGWKLIDGYWYFFDSEGTMLVNTLTPDGYLVGADGKWIKQ